MKYSEQYTLQTTHRSKVTTSAFQELEAGDKQACTAKIKDPRYLERLCWALSGTRVE